MLTDTDAARQIAQRIQAQDASLWEKIVQWFKDFEQKLRSAYNGLKPGSGIAKEAKKTLQQVDGLVKMWADMAVDSAENYRTADNKESASQESNKEKYSLREFTDGTRFVDVELDEHTLDNMTLAEMNRFAKRMCSRAGLALTESPWGRTEATIWRTAAFTST